MNQLSQAVPLRAIQHLLKCVGHITHGHTDEAKYGLARFSYILAPSSQDLLEQFGEHIEEWLIRVDDGNINAIHVCDAFSNNFETWRNFYFDG